jgi:transcriptional regulator with XRE-family HTH domain
MESMNAGRSLVHARRRAHLTQRALAERTGVAQPTIARIESGTETPRVDTLERLLRSCGDTLDVLPRAGTGIDRTGIGVLLAMSPAQRVAALIEEAPVLDRLATARRLR